jgi:S1-C subfamily serine protease
MFTKKSIMNKIIVICLFLLSSINSTAQKTIEYPTVDTYSNVQECLIRSIEMNDKYTVVNIRFVNALGRAWIREFKNGNSKAPFISDEYGNKLADIISYKNIAVMPARTSLVRNQILDYVMIFGPIDYEKIKKIDITSNVKNAFNYYGVNLNGSNQNVTPKIENPKLGGNIISTGSGFCINNQGYIVTNYHVVKDAKTIELYFNINDKKIIYQAIIDKIDKINDIAILKIEDPSFVIFNKIPFEFSDEYDVGDDVFTIGFPQPDVMGVEPKLTSGIINSISGIDNDLTCMQISAQIQPGNSGGPLYNNKGNVIGITSSSLNSIFIAKTKGNIPQNVNYAIKVDYLKALLKPIKMNGINNLMNISLAEKTKILKEFICLVIIKN